MKKVKTGSIPHTLTNKFHMDQKFKYKKINKTTQGVKFLMLWKSPHIKITITVTITTILTSDYINR